MIHTTLVGRRARPDEIPAIRRMQERSLRVLGADYYDPRDIEAFLDAFSTMDDAVVDEGHYFVLATPQDRVVASGGWSQQAPGYSRGAETFDAGAATIRSVFVDPDFCRQGLGAKLMRLVESDATAAAIQHLIVSATLSGIPLYAAMGYREIERKVMRIGASGFALVRMEKRLSAGASNENGPGDARTVRNVRT